jgi:hypothetical protein
MRRAQRRNGAALPRGVRQGGADRVFAEYQHPEFEIDWSRSDGPLRGIYAGWDEARRFLPVTGFDAKHSPAR